MKQVSHSDLALLAFGKYRGLVVFRIRKAGIESHADIADVSSLVYDKLLSLAHLPEAGEELQAINYAISDAIGEWLFSRDRNGVPVDPGILEAAS